MLHDRLRSAWEPIVKAFRNHDFDARNVSWRVFEEALDCIAREIGDPLRGTTHGSWLAWFVFDNDCGRKGMDAKAGAWPVARPIRTAADLTDLILADKIEE
jgi:hypothetical protein